MVKSPRRYYAITVVISSLFLISSLGACSNVDGVFLTPMAEGLGVSRGAITLYTSISGVAGSFLYPLAYRLTKRIPLRTVFVIGISAAAASCIGMAAARSIYGIYLFAALRGFGTTCYASNMVVLFLNRWFKDKASTVTGMALCTTGLSAAIFNPMFTSLILSLGYRQALLIRAGVILLTALPGALLFMKETPDRVGLEPYTTDKPEEKPRRAREQTHRAPLRFRSGLFFMLLVYIILSRATARMVDQLPGYAESIGWGPRVGALLASAYMVGTVFFKLVLGVINDAAGVIRTSLAAGLVSLAAVGILVAFPGSVFLLLVGAFLFSIMMALASVSVFALVRYTYGDEQVGAAMSRFAPLSAVYPMLLSVYGFLYDATGTFNAVFALGAGFNLVCLLAVVYIGTQARKESRLPDPGDGVQEAE